VTLTELLRHLKASPEPDILAGSPDHHLKYARFNHPFHGPVQEGKVMGGKLKVKGFLFPWFE
jgi:hypothetical protein